MRNGNVTKKMKLVIMALCLVLGLSFMSAPVTVHAAERNAVIMEVANGEQENNAGGSSYDMGWLGGDSNEAFSELEEEVKQTGNSAYKLMMAIGGAGMLLCFIACGIMFMVSGSGQDRSKTLGWLLRICVGGVIIFGAIGFIGIIQNVGGNLL